MAHPKLEIEEAAQVFSTKEVEIKTGVTRRALRHYEKLGLLQPIINPDNGYRRYAEDDLKRLQHIVTMKRLGFKLADISTELAKSPSLLSKSLTRRQQILSKKIHALAAANRALTDLPLDDHCQSADDVLAHVTQRLETQDGVSWYTQTSETQLRATYLAPFSKQEANRIRQGWSHLIERAEALKQRYTIVDERTLSSSEISTLADDWMSALFHLIGPDETSYRALCEVYETLGDLPPDRRFFAPALGPFISQIMKDWLSRHRLTHAGFVRAAN